MFPFSHSVTPAVRAHLDAQLNFFNDMSKALSRSFQRMCELNIQLSQTLLEEGGIASQQLLTTDRGNDAISITAARAQPAANKLRAYQQHVSRIVADAQRDLARIAEQHAPITSRTASDLAEQVAQAAGEETEENAVKQHDMMNSFRDPFQAHGAEPGNFSAGSGNLQSGQTADEMNGKHSPAVQGGEQRSTLHQASKNKADAKPV